MPFFVAIVDGKNRVLVGYHAGEDKSDDGTIEPEAIILGFYHTLGGGFRVYYEGTLFDTDQEADPDFGDRFDDDLSQHLFGFRYDF